MARKPTSSDELEYPKDADQGAIYGPVSTANTAHEDQDTYPDETFGTVPNIPTTNVKGFVPYRGGEQHGVRFNHDSKTSTPEISHYQAEQAAFDSYHAKDVTPRDLSPVPPIRVQVVNNPNLLARRRADIRTVVVFASSGLVQLVGHDWNRTRLLITAYSSGANVVGWLKTKNDANKSFDALRVVANNTGSSAVLLDTAATSQFWFSVDDVDQVNSITLGLYWERPVYDGENLLNG